MSCKSLANQTCASVVEVTQTPGVPGVVQNPALKLMDPEKYLEAELDRALRANERRYLHGPIIKDKLGSAWEIPDWLMQVVSTGRVRQIIEEDRVDDPDESPQASLEEVLVVLMTAGLAYPLNSASHDVFIWTAAQILSRYGRATSENWVLTQIVGPSDVDRYATLSYDAQQVLERLRRDIRRQVEKKR